MGERDLAALEQYDITVFRVGKGRESMVLETDKGLLLLKEYDGSVERADAEYRLLEELSEGINVDGYILNKEGVAVTTMPDGKKYILKKGADGREVDLKKYDEVCLAVRSLAGLHIELERVAKACAGEPYMEQFKHDREFGEDIRRHHKELKRVRNYIRGQRKKNDFELKVLECFNLFYEQGEKVLEYIEYFESGSESGADEMILCHGNYNQHNIILGQTGKDISIINFDKACFSYGVTDLYFFMRKCLEKQDYDVDLGIGIIKEYESVRALTAFEKKILYVLFLYPEKFWKIVNHYYNGNKAWVSQKSISKLQTLIEQEEARQKFLYALSVL
ncbi:MAG: spore coat protein CotS [Lachnospiraceae bacterium]|nr:spore coat protein CotS [Lachnospiraceae bacterium]